MIVFATINVKHTLIEQVELAGLKVNITMVSGGKLTETYATTALAQKRVNTLLDILTNVQWKLGQVNNQLCQSST